MIKLQFAYNREQMFFLVKAKEVYYTDKMWKAWIRCLPPPKDFLLKIQKSRNKLPASLAVLFEYTDEELQQYAEAGTEDQIADIIVKDARGKGCRLISRASDEGDRAVS